LPAISKLKFCTAQFNFLHTQYNESCSAQNKNSRCSKAPIRTNIRGIYNKNKIAAVAVECWCWLLLFGVLSLAMAAAPMANGPRVALVMARLAIQQGLRLQGACFHSVLLISRPHIHQTQPFGQYRMHAPLVKTNTEITNILFFPRRSFSFCRAQISLLNFAKTTTPLRIEIEFLRARVVVVGEGLDIGIEVRTMDFNDEMRGCSGQIKLGRELIVC